jgi:glycosyltransferase involved in cell wall biosynthesis
MLVAIVDLLGSPYDGSTLVQRGLGGSESAVISIARELVKAGLYVDVYNDCTSMDATPGNYGGVYYNDRNDLSNPDAYEVMISSRSVRPFLEPRVNPKQKRILWMHDTFAEGDGQLESMVVNGLIDEIWTLSDFHTQYLSTCDHGHKRMGEVLKRKIWQTRNGVHLYNDHIDFKNKNPNRFVWNAATNKGLAVLLNSVWPRVRELIPTAQLDVIGGYYKLKGAADVQQQEWDLLKKMHAGKDGVCFTGVIPQDEVASYLEFASFFIYPQALPETFGISTLEALANGVTPITGRFGALEEIAIEEASYLMDYPAVSNTLYSFNDEAHIQAFVNLVVSAWDDQYLWAQKANKALSVRDICTWDTIALQWKQHLYNITGRYLPVDEYRKVTEINQRVKEVFNTKWSNPEERTVNVSDRFQTWFQVVVPFRNAEKWIRRCIESIVAQDYEAYEVTLIADDPTDDSIAIAESAIAALPDRIRHGFTLTKNSKSVGALSNQCRAIEYFTEEEVVVLIDGDDRLANDPHIFSRLNRLYKNGGRFTYGSSWSDADNIPLIAQAYPPNVLKERTYRDYKFAWNVPYTHLRTFEASLYHRCDKSLLTDESGAFHRAGGDTALFYALMDVVEPDGIRVVRDILYHYNDMNPENDYKINSEEQTRTANKAMSQRIDDRTDSINNQYEDSFHHSDTVKKILIAIPTANGIHPETFKAIYDLDIPVGYKADFQFFYGYCVDQVRNLIADWVVRGYDYLFSVDYDMEFQPDTLRKLIEADKDIVSGLYRQRKEEVIYEAYTLISAGSHINLRPGMLNTETLTRCSAVGLGCALIKKEVFVEIGYPQFKYHHALLMEHTKSEDVDFCEKATAKGFSIWLDPAVVCNHWGKTSFNVA